jgi:hypothetical protein
VFHSTRRLPQGGWASDQVSLTVTDSGANLQLLASGGCFGSYGQIPEAISEGQFSTTGTYTQLIGPTPAKWITRHNTPGG